jgi:hypothetical protein
MQMVDIIVGFRVHPTYIVMVGLSGKPSSECKVSFLYRIDQGKIFVGGLSWDTSTGERCLFSALLFLTLLETITIL